MLRERLGVNYGRAQGIWPECCSGVSISAPDRVTEMLSRNSSIGLQPITEGRDLPTLYNRLSIFNVIN
jgi:hypothetical protein